MGRLPKNFRVRRDSGSLQIRFSHKGRLHRRDYPPDVPRAEAIRRGKAFMDRVRTGVEREPSRDTVAAAITAWLDGPAKARSSKAHANAGCRLRRIVNLLGQLRVDEFDSFKSWRLKNDLAAAWSPWTVRAALQDLRAAMAFSGHPITFPAGLVPRPRSTPDPLSLDQFGRILDAAPPDLRWIVRLLALTGLRWGEWVRLEWRHVRELPHPHLLLERSKNGESRAVPLFPEARAILSDRPRLGPFVSPYRSQNGHVLVRRIRPGFDWHVHQLRHTCATMLREAGWPISAVQSFLGHRSMTSTMCYAGWGEDVTFTVAESRPVSTWAHVPGTLTISGTGKESEVVAK